MLQNNCLSSENLNEEIAASLIYHATLIPRERAEYLELSSLH
jgi:hypothetical protein